MKLSRDLALGLASSMFAAAIGLAVVPVYIRLLGTASYGLIGFFATTQAVVQLLDLGLSATINRETARHVASDSLGELGKLLHTLSVVYVATALAIAALATLAAPLLASHWLNSSTLNVATLRAAVILLAIVVACRWPIGLYQGVLLGGHKLGLVSTVAIAMTALGSIGAVLVLSHVSATIEAFFLWQAGVGLTQAVILRALAWRLVGTRGLHRFDWSELKRVWGFTAGMSGIAIAGMLFMQTDKIVLSRVLSLEAYGQYMLATVAASGLYLVLTPTFNLIFPKLSALYLRSEQELAAYYRQGTRTLTAVLFPLSTVAIVFARDLMFLWTGDAALADASAPIVQLILVGTTLNGIMNFPYALQLASGKTRIAITTNIILLVIMLPLTILLSIRRGAIGGAAAWAILNAIYLVLGTWLTHRSLLQDIGARWLALDVAVPLLATVAVVGSSCVWLSQAALSRPAAIGAALCVGAALALVLMHAHRLRPALELKPVS